MPSDFRIIKSLEWCTELPSKDCSRESPIFLLQGNEWFFKFILVKPDTLPTYYYNLYLEFKSKSAESERCWTTFQVGFKEEQMLSLDQSRFMVSGHRRQQIWNITMENLQSKLPSDYTDGNWIKFLFCFDNVSGSLLKISREEEDKCFQTASYLNPKVPVESSTEDFFKLLDSGLNHDAEIRCGDRSIRAHKIILCARSEVFKAMLESDMLEGRSGIVEIQDIDVNYIGDFVRYLYTGEMPELDFDKAKVLYESGDKYAIQSLMLRCSEYLQDNLSEENVFQCFGLADAHSDEKLKDTIRNYILEKKMYLQDELWLPFCDSYPKTAIEVYRLSHKRKASERDDL